MKSYHTFCVRLSNFFAIACFATAFYRGFHAGFGVECTSALVAGITLGFNLMSVYLENKEDEP